MLSPRGCHRSRNLDFLDVQFAVSVRANIFNLGTPELQHVSPRARFNRHAKPPQAGAATVTLVADGEIEKPERELEPDPHQGGIEKVETELVPGEVE